MIIALVVILLAAVGFLVIQNYRVYDNEGNVHWNLPFMPHKETQEPDIDPNDVEIDRQEPQFVAGKDLTPLQAKELPLWCLNDDPAWMLTDAPQSVVVNVKNADGALLYSAKAATPEGVSKGGEYTLANLRTILDSNHGTVARMACLCDSAYARAMTEQAALCGKDGTLWWDPYGRCWLDPAKEGTLTYVKALCQELVTLGFDEIVLDYFGYPASWQGNADRTAVLTQFMTALRESLPEGTRISLLLREMPGAENGLTAELLNASFDRIYTDNGVNTETLIKMLPADFDAATRLVPIVWRATENGSYMIATN